MGRSFSNIQIRYPEPVESFDTQKLISLLTNGRSLSCTDKEEEADIIINVCMLENSPWITITSDIIDGDVDTQLKCAQSIANGLQTEVMAISCFDSDYLFLNLVDPKNEKDIWASCGSFPYGKAPRKSNFSSWKNYVPNISDFSRIMRAGYTFAEECLHGLEPMLSLPVSQSMCTIEDEPADARLIRFYFKLTDKGASGRAPEFKNYNSSLYYNFKDNVNYVSFLNHGDAFRGVAVCLAGPCISKQQIRVKSIELLYIDAHGKRTALPVSLEKKTFSNGVAGLYGECPMLRVPSAVPEDLPYMKKTDMEFHRSLGVRFSLTADIPDDSVNTLGNLHVILIPLSNFSGQGGWVMKPLADEKTLFMEFQNSPDE